MDEANKANQPTDDHISALIRSRDSIILNEDVLSLTSVNDKGIFDVLPRHESFISIIKDFIIVRKKNGEKKEIKIDRGVIKVYKNIASVYLGILSVNSKK